MVEDWEVLERRLVFRHRRWVSLYEEDVRLPDGTVVEGYLTAEAPSGTMVVGLTDEEQVVVLRGYRHGPRAVTYSLPGGGLDDGEDPLVGARREFLEETGFAGGEWTLLGEFTHSANRGMGTAHLYLARGVRQVARPESGDLEATEVELRPLDELLAEVFAGHVHVFKEAGALALAAVALRAEG
ncbi:NUDIX hydrolase [Longispora urticae]